MPANTAPIFPLSPVVGIATLTAATAITSRANITGTTGLVQLAAISSNGKRIDAILVKGKATSVASNVFVWIYNGTTSFLYDEVSVPAVTASNTNESVLVQKNYQTLVLPPSFSLYISQSVQTDLNVYALGGDY